MAIRLLILLAVLSLSVSAEDIYVSQNTAGGDTGADCANAHSLSWLNTSGNWGAGAGKVSAGDTVHLCGTLTNTLQILGSGTAGNPITILFETGANFSAPYWGNHAQVSNSIYASGRSFITIDGGANGVIQSTANGISQSYTNPMGTPEGIWMNTMSDVRIKNLTVKNMYFMHQQLYDGTAGLAAQGIVLGGPMTNVTVDHCTVLQVGNAIVLNPFGYSTNVLIMANHCTSNSWGLFYNSTSGGQGAFGYSFASNFFDHFEAFEYTNSDGTYQNVYHNDSIIINANPTPNGVTNTGMRIYCNTFGPSVGVGCSADIYSYSSNPNAFESPVIYNNLFLQNTNTHISNGNIGLGMHNAFIANNTMISSNNGMLCADIIIQTGSHWVNNLTYQASQWITCSSGDNTLGPVESDYNVLYCGLRAITMNQPFNSFPFQWTWGQWINPANNSNNITFDSHSTSNGPVIFLPGADFTTMSYVPTNTDTYAYQKGTNLTAMGITTDFYGNPRAAVGAWNIGAFENTNNAAPSGTIGVFPTSLNFGTILTNTSSSLTFYVTNSGNAVLVGQATTSSPFSITSPPSGNYSVGINAAQTVTVQYSPTTAASDSGTVTCTGGGGATVSLSGSATNAPFFGVTTKISGNVTISGATVIK